MKFPKYKIIFRYKNITLWKYNKIFLNKLTKRKWIELNNKKYKRYYKGNAYYICHYKKLKLERIHYFKFINKQILRGYLVNYKEYNFKKYLLKNYLSFEKRLDFNVYKAHFSKSLYEARFFIIKGFILVNGHKITTFNYLLKLNDKVEINKKYFDLVQQSLNFNAILDLNYIKNLEIDYKTLSFVFLDKKSFYILNYDNFLKHIYCLRYKTKHKKFENVNHYFNTNLNTYKNNNYRSRKNAKLNNYFKFFDYILRYYVFIDKKNILLKKKYFKKFKLTSYETRILTKIFKNKYSTYYFRNLLLKRTFNYKYNYLYFVNNVLFNNYNFENINKLFNQETYFYKNEKNELTNQFFKYYYNLIFKFYIILLQNYYITNFEGFNFSVKYPKNNYKRCILLYSKIFKLLVLKNKLFYFYHSLNLNKSLTLKNERKFRILKYKYLKYKTEKVPFYRKKTYYYLTKNSYINFLYYISSKQFRLRYYKYSWNNKIKRIKKYRLFYKFLNSFTYERYNISRLGTDRKCYTKHFVYISLITLNKKNRNINLKKKFDKYKNVNIKKFMATLTKKHLYYALTSDIYKYVYRSAIHMRDFEKNKIKKDFIILRSLIKKLDLNSKIYKNLIKNLKIQYNFLDSNKKLKNLNYNKIAQRIFLLKNLVKFYKKNISETNLKHLNYFTVLYKSSVKINRYRSFNYSIFVRRRDRILVEPLEKRFNLYIRYHKPKLCTSILFKNYFKLNKFVKLSKFDKKTSNILNYHKFKYHQIPNLKKKKDINFILNLETINNNFEFDDLLFFKDLFLNVSTRKLNYLYNNISFVKIGKKELYNSFNSDIKNEILVNKNKRIIFRKLKRKRKHFIILVYRNKFYNYNQNLKKYVLIRKINLKSNKRLTEQLYNKYYIYKKIDKKYIINLKKYHSLVNNYNFKNKKINRKIYKLKFELVPKRKTFTNTNKFTVKFYNPYTSKYLNFPNKITNIENIYKIYLYYSFYFKKYKIIKYIFNDYIFKEYLNILDRFIKKESNLKYINYLYIKQLHFNLLYSKIFNFNKYDYLLKNNFKYSRNLKIIINYFILIKRFYK